MGKKKATRRTHAYYSGITSIEHVQSGFENAICTIDIEKESCPLVHDNCTIWVRGFFHEGKLMYRSIDRTAYITTEEAQQILENPYFQRIKVIDIRFKDEKVFVDLKHKKEVWSASFGSKDEALLELSDSFKYDIKQSYLDFLNKTTTTAEIKKKKDPSVRTDTVTTPMIMAIDPHLNITNKTISVRLRLSSKGKSKFTNYFSNFDDVIEYINKNKLIGAEDARKKIERIKLEWKKELERTEKNTLPAEKKEFKINTTDDLSPVFREQYLQYEKSKLPDNPIDIYLGLDFGTSFTKLPIKKIYIIKVLFVLKTAVSNRLWSILIVQMDAFPSLSQNKMKDIGKYGFLRQQ